MSKKNKPGRNQGDPNHTPVPHTRAHSEKVKYTKKEQREQAKKEAKDQE